MSQSAGYFIVEASAMPEIFRKVAEAKRLLETGEETTVNGAARAVGISRSAFYKYKDAVRPFNDMLHGRIVTFQTMLRDEPGILSGLLNIFAGTGRQYSDHQPEHPHQRLRGGHHYGGDLRPAPHPGGDAGGGRLQPGRAPVRDFGGITESGYMR